MGRGFSRAAGGGCCATCAGSQSTAAPHHATTAGHHRASSAAGALTVAAHHRALSVACAHADARVGARTGGHAGASGQDSCNEAGVAKASEMANVGQVQISAWTP